MLEERNQRHVYLAPTEVEALARASRDQNVADFIRLLALTGLRRGELLSLQPADIVDGCILLDARTKTGLPRAVPLTPQAARIAAKRLPWSVGYPTIRTEWERAREAVGKPELHMHDLRHTYASWLVQGNVGMKSVKDLLGHTTMATTDRYTHLAVKHLKAASAGLPKLRGSGVGHGKSRGAQR